MTMDRLFSKGLKKKINSKNMLPIIKNSGWLLFDKMIRILLGLFVSAWVARYLGPSEFGTLAYVLAYLAFFQCVVTLGMDGIVVRDITNYPELSGELLGTVSFLRTLAGLVGWLVAVIIMVLTYGCEHQNVILTILSGATLIFQASDTIDLWFQSQSQSKRTVVAKLIAYLTSSAIKIILVIFKAPLFAFAAVIAIDVITSSLGLLYAYRTYPCHRKWVVSVDRAKVMLREAWPFILSSLSIIIYMRIDQVMINNMLGKVELGIYAAVQPLGSIWSFIPITLSISLAPYIARKKQESHNVYCEALAHIFRYFALLGWVIVIPVCVLSGFIVTLLFGDEYASGSLVLSVLVFTNIFINLGVAQGMWILNEKKSKLSLYKTLCGAVVCVCGNFMLIPTYGITGAAISAVLAQFTSAVLTNIIFCREMFYLQIKSIFLMKYAGRIE